MEEHPIQRFFFLPKEVVWIKEMTPPKFSCIAFLTSILHEFSTSTLASFYTHSHRTVACHFSVFRPNDYYCNFPSLLQSSILYMQFYISKFCVFPIRVFYNHVMQRSHEITLELCVAAKSGCCIADSISQMRHCKKLLFGLSWRPARMSHAIIQVSLVAARLVTNSIHHLSKL
jgi:hypothetical protein